MALRPTTLALLCALPVVAGANPEDDADRKINDRPRLSPSLDLLPAGSTLKDVRIPRYDENLRRAALLRAGTLEVISENHVTGSQIELRVFDQQGHQTVAVNMVAAEYFRELGTLEAKEQLTVHGEGFLARGSGAIFQLDSRQGFLPGPVFTSFQRPLRKKRPSAPRTARVMTDPRRLLAAGSMLALALPAGSEPLPLNATELDELDTMVASRSDTVLADAAPTREIITRSDQLGRSAEVGMQSFSRRLGEPAYLVVAPPAEGSKPEVPPRPQDGIEVTCKGGMYFDADKGIVVYLKDIKVLEPRFEMTAAKELKVFLERREDAEERGLQGPEAFGDVKTIVATGGVVVIRPDPKGKREAVIASADTATYDAQSGDFVLRGGFPTLRQGNNSLQAGEPGLYLRFYANGNFFAEKGTWKTIGDIAKLRKTNENQ